jgi:hypothetical protein
MSKPAITDDPHPVITTTKMQDLAYNAYHHFILLSPTPHVKHMFSETISNQNFVYTPDLSH